MKTLFNILLVILSTICIGIAIALAIALVIAFVPLVIVAGLLQLTVLLGEFFVGSIE